MRYEAHFSARKEGAIGSFYSVRVVFEDAPGLDRESGFIPAHKALSAEGYECHHLISLRAGQVQS